MNYLRISGNSTARFFRDSWIGIIAFRTLNILIGWKVLHLFFPTKNVPAPQTLEHRLCVLEGYIYLYTCRVELHGGSLDFLEEFWKWNSDFLISLKAFIFVVFWGGCFGVVHFNLTQEGKHNETNGRGTENYWIWYILLSQSCKKWVCYHMDEEYFFTLISGGQLARAHPSICSKFIGKP